MRPRPQMLSRVAVSEDRKTYRFELREGLAFSDGSPVTAADCVASVRRWAARDGGGQHLFLRVLDTPVRDEGTFEIVLREPYELLIEVLAKTSTNVCYIMRRKEAETDPNQQVTTSIGSGPFLFNQDETRHGATYVYDRNPAYRPREEAPSGTAGGKVVRLDRVVWDNMDELTAVSALQAGEIDFHEVPPLDSVPELERDPKLKVEILNAAGNIGSMRLNFLYPPFDRVEARRAMLHLVDQNAILQATFVDPKYFRTCGAYFGCGTPMENDAATEWFTVGQNIAKAKELFRKAGYDGRPVVILQTTNIAFGNNAAQLIAQWLRQAGVNAELAPSDWGGVVTRRASKKPPAEGGWNAFVTWSSAQGLSNPVAHVAHRDRREGLVRLALRPEPGGPAGQMGREPRPSRSAARSPARSRPTPGTSSPASILGSGRTPSPTGRSCVASLPFQIPPYRSGTWRKPPERAACSLVPWDGPHAPRRR